MGNSATDNSYGGRFLVEHIDAGQVFVPEGFGAEARAIARVADRFLREEVLPRVEEIEGGDHALMQRLMRRAGELGLLGADVPRVYGGLGLPVSTAALIAEKLNPQQSFALTHEAHTVIATLPLLYFGNHDQKSRYLPKLASGEWIGSFALSEANSGSDALAASTRGVLSTDGSHYILNGMKMWITNTGFAQLFTVFGQIDDGERPRFTAFLVERGARGLSFGQEERKLGMRGTSTRRVMLDDVHVPVENVLEVGKGQYAAFCALNMGRFKLEAGAVGGLKETLTACARYASERRAFGHHLGEFGLVKHKLAEMAARTFALESMVYRLAGDLDGVFEGIATDAEDASTHFHRAAEEFAIECNIVKVIGSETYSRMTDEAIQIHGGYGYTENFPVARAWRDQRLLRIGEGANEIVRLAVVNLILRRQAQGRLSLPATPLPQPSPCQGEGEDVLAGATQNVRRLAVWLVDLASTRLEKELMEAQETVAAVADVVCLVYALDSVRVRVEKLEASGHANAGVARLMAEIAARDFVDEAVAGAKSSLDSMEVDDWRGGEIGTFLSALERPWANVVRQRREMADVVVERGGWPLE